MTLGTVKPMPPTQTTLDVDLDERHQGDVDAFIERNRDDLNESIRGSREEFERGDYCKLSFDKILAACRERHSTNS